MKCILLCAGYATRLFPLTENFPKALLEVGKRPLLDYILDDVNEINEVDEIYLVTNAKYTPHFEKWAESKNNIKPISVLNDGTYNNDDRLGAIGDILFTLKNKKVDDDVIAIAGDNLIDFKLTDFVQYAKEKNSPAIAIKEHEWNDELKRFGIAEIDENNKVIGFEEKPADPKSNCVAYAEYIYPQNTLKLFDKYIKEGNPSDAPGNFIKFLHKETDVYGFKFTGECYDVGTHESLALVNEIFKNK